MSEYEIEAWRRLGKLIRRQRTRLRIDTDEWASLVGRTSRVLLGLERGEKTGEETLRRVEELLGWAEGSIESILAGGEPTLVPEQPTQGRPLSVVPTTMEQVPDELEDNEVLAAIRRDPALTPTAKAHFLNQYELLWKLSRHESYLLSHVAEGDPTRPPDPKLEAEIDADVRRAARENPNSPYRDK